MVLDFILPILVDLIADPIRQCIVSPITRHVGYALKCNSKVQTLNDELVLLKNMKERLQRSVDNATNNGDKIYENVSMWLSRATKTIGEAEELVQQKEEVKMKCLAGLCPNLKTRYQLGKNSDKRASAIDRLRKEEGLDPISFPPPLQQIVQPTVYSREALPSRVAMLNQIVDALKDPDVNMIGVYGMGGVGKSTLAKEVRAKAIQETLFDTAILVPVSQTPELRRIQGEIADFLEMAFNAEEIPGRASQLYQRLDKSNVLIILDDLCKILDLSAIGIPFGGASKGCKIMLTSRNEDLLSNEMGAQKLFSLKVLKEEETLSLFEISVPEAKDPNFQAIAAKIAKKCAGLPLLIQIVATELKNKESYAWNDKLNQLSAYDDEEIYEKVYKVLESSYENLPGRELKSFFLLCALFGQANIHIQYLLAYCTGLGLFKHIRTIEDARDKVLTLITKLKAKSLLLDGDMVGFVKMHDVIRDTALNIASRVQHAFIGTSEVKLRDWPNKDCTRISLPYCDVSELPVSLDCPEAVLFLLFTENLCLEVPEKFFSGNEKLRVLDFTGMRLMSLPPSIALLKNLQSLCLHKCQLENVAVLGELKQLELLSFVASEIVELPTEMEALTRLKLLDLTDCTKLLVIPVNLLSRLCSLEELYMLNSFVRWDAKGNVSLVELESLSHLLILEIKIPSLKLIPRGFKCLNRLRRYKIHIGNAWSWTAQYERSRMLKLKVEPRFYMDDGIELLLRRTEELYLDGMKGIESVFFDGFPNLKYLEVDNDYTIQYLIKSTMRPSCHAFPILESLHINKLQGLEKICNGQLGNGSFGRLQVLKISHCDRLRSLFPFSSVKCLSQLRELEVEFCENFEAITGGGSEDMQHNCPGVIEFTQLCSLVLSNLPQLQGFFKIEEENEQTGLLSNAMVSFPNLTSLEVRECKNLKHIFTASMAKSFVRLRNLEIENCESLQEIIQNEKIQEIDEGSTKRIVFPELDRLSLVDLQNVERFSSFHSTEFPLLKELTLANCKAMRNFTPKLSRMESEECLFSDMVDFPNLERLFVSDMDNFTYLWDEQFLSDDSFFKLKVLYLTKCSRLSVVFPSKMNTRFQSVEKLGLSHCDRVEEIYQKINFKEKKNVFSLRDLEIYYLPSLKHIWNKDESEVSTFENLHSVEVDACNGLKYVFPESVGCGLVQLQRLHLGNCNLQVMIAEGKDHFDGHNLSFCFPELTKLELKDLKEMRSLYEGPHTIECPKLKSLRVLQCSNLYFGKFIANLEDLTIDDRRFHAPYGCATTEFSVDLCSKLKKVTLLYFDQETSNMPILFGFLRKLKSLEMLVLESCFLEDMFGIDDALGQRVRHFEFRDVGNLKHLLKKDSQLNQLLQSLLIRSCNEMMNVSPFSTSLQNLTILHIQDCYCLKYLVTASTAKTMVQLTELEVESCSAIEEIVTKDGDPADDGVIIFSKLRRLELDELLSLESFCSNKHTFNFPLLEQVTVRYCPKMKFFCGGDLSTPKLRGILYEDEQRWEGNLNDTISSQIREWVGKNLEEGRLFQNVEWLQLENNAISSTAISARHMLLLNNLKMVTIRDCDLVQVVFDLDGLSASEGDIGLAPELCELHLINLPMLSQLFNKAPSGILDFNSLCTLSIDNCIRLKYVFTWSMASSLSQLLSISVTNCQMMETLIIDEEVDPMSEVIFSTLAFVTLENMPRFSSIYTGRSYLECPSLEEIHIRDCTNIQEFISGHNHYLVLPKLGKLSIDMKCITGMMLFERPTNLFSKLKTLEVCHSSATTRSHVPLAHFLSRLPNLDQLNVCNSSFKELLNSNLEQALTMPQIKSLSLNNLDHLNKIWWHTFLFQSLETLEVCFCGKLINLASSSASFQNLITLQVQACNQLTYLMTPSMARNMLQLKELRVLYCEMLMEIVADGSEETTDEVVFTKLETLELRSLPSFEGFSLTHCNFIFPCLDQVIVDNLPNMRIFCHEIVNTPILNYVKRWELFANCYWEGDLNTTTKHLYHEMVGFEDAKKIKLSEFPFLKEKWEGQFPYSFFSSLEKLQVDDPELISSAIPSHLLQHLERLEVLNVKNCDSLEQVFDLEGLNADECGINQMENLKELRLIDLPRLKQVWSKDPHQILSFRNLQFLKVDNCGMLTYIFNLEMALSLQKLQHLEVRRCNLVEYVIVIAEDEIVQEYETMFSSLQSMSLQHLTKLLSFSSTSGVLECSSLKMIEVVDCPNVELFASTFSEGSDSSISNGETGQSTRNEDPNSVAAILRNKMVIPELQELKVEWKALKDELTGNYQSGLFSRLKCIELAGEQCAISPSTLLYQLPKLEKLILSDALIEELNLNDLSILKDKDQESPAMLTKFKLSKLPKLKNLVQHGVQVVPLLQHLEDLELLECNSLKILVPSSLPLQNLANLQVSKCNGLMNLVSGLTARSLAQLRRMEVKDCKKMQEIVEISLDSEEHEILFCKLEYLELDGLPCLTAFSSGNYDLHFPSLLEVTITGCPNMKNFSGRATVTPMLSKIKTGTETYDWEWKGSLDDTIKPLFMENETDWMSSKNG